MGSIRFVKLFVETRHKFPDPRLPTMDGIVAMGDELSVDTLLEAYSFGIFPWPHEDLPCLWFCSDHRGVLDFADLKVSKSLQKFMRKSDWRVSFNTSFEQVIRSCASAPRLGQKGTWITEPIVKAYLEFHRAGYAHSVECWDEANLVGGLYGVYVGGVMSGESMFFKKSNASKVCLLSLVDVLKKNGLRFLDIQMTTSVTESMGGKCIPKLEFLDRLRQLKKTAKPLKFDL